MGPLLTLSPESRDALTALVVEDETIVSFLIEDMLRDLGCETVCHAAGSRQALHLIDRHSFGIAVLDVNLGQDSIEPVADRLQAAEIPFVFSTGYGRSGLPARFSGYLVLQKPFVIEDLIRALRTVLALAEKPKSR